MFEEKKTFINKFPLKKSRASRVKRCVINVDQRKLTDRQKSVLVDFIKKNMHLILPKVTTHVTRPDRQITENLWKKIAKELNQIPGAIKPWRKWRKSWQHLYRFARQNLNAFQQRANMGILTDTQMQLLNLINLTTANDISVPMSPDPTENDMAGNLSDDDDVFLEEEWLEDIDVNDKESELETIDRSHLNIQELKSIPAQIETKTSTKESSLPTPETSKSSLVRISHPEENDCKLEPLVSKRKEKSGNHSLDHSNFNNPEISFDRHSRNRKRELSSRESELISRERELLSRERELLFQENELKRRGFDPLHREFELINRERELILREREVIRREHELLSRESELLTLNRELLDFERKLVFRAKEVTKLEDAVRDKIEKRMKSVTAVHNMNGTEEAVDKTSKNIFIVKEYDSCFFNNSDDDDG